MMKTYRIAPRESNISQHHSRPNSPKNSIKNNISAKIKSVRNTDFESKITNNSSLSNLFGFKFSSSKLSNEKKSQSPVTKKQFSNTSNLNQVKKDAKIFIDDLSDLRMSSTSLYAFIDNELFKVKQFKESQFNSIESVTNEMISGIIDIKNHIVGNLECEYKDCVSFLKKIQLQFNKSINLFDTTLRTMHPQHKLSKNDLNNLEKKLSNCNLNVSEDKLISKQISVIKIAENFNFKETIEKVIINQAFSLDTQDIDCKKLEVYTQDLKKLCDKINANVKEIEMQSIMGVNKEWEKENLFMQTLNNERKCDKFQPAFCGSFKKKFEDLNFFVSPNNSNFNFFTNKPVVNTNNNEFLRNNNQEPTKSCITPRSTSNSLTPKSTKANQIPNTNCENSHISMPNQFSSQNESRVQSNSFHSNSQANNQQTNYDFQFCDEKLDVNINTQHDTSNISTKNVSTKNNIDNNNLSNTNFGLFDSFTIDAMNIAENPEQSERICKSRFIEHVETEPNQN